VKLTIFQQPTKIIGFLTLQNVLRPWVHDKNFEGKTFFVGAKTTFSACILSRSFELDRYVQV